MEHTHLELKVWVSILDRYTVYKNGSQLESMMESNPEYVLKGEDVITYNRYMDEKSRLLGQSQPAVNEE